MFKRIKRCARSLYVGLRFAKILNRRKSYSEVKKAGDSMRDSQLKAERLRIKSRL